MLLFKHQLFLLVYVVFVSIQVYVKYDENSTSFHTCHPLTAPSPRRCRAGQFGHHRHQGAAVKVRGRGRAGWGFSVCFVLKFVRRFPFVLCQSFFFFGVFRLFCVEVRGCGRVGWVLYNQKENCRLNNHINFNLKVIRCLFALNWKITIFSLKSLVTMIPNSVSRLFYVKVRGRGWVGWGIFRLFYLFRFIS